jgi:hypothetical protein
MQTPDKKTVTIIVNTRPKEWAEKKISFQQVVELAFGTYIDDPKSIYTVTYSRGADKHEGTLVKGQDVPVKDGMIFNVTQTTES